jgi:hypothetical protein
VGGAVVLADVRLELDDPPCSRLGTGGSVGVADEARAEEGACRF